MKSKNIRRNYSRVIEKPELQQSNQGIYVLAAFFLIALVLLMFRMNSIGSQQEEASLPMPTPFVRQELLATPTPTLDLDPVVDCEYPVECGGTIKVKSSICANTTCCKIADRAFITSQEQCNEAVNKYNEAVRQGNANMEKIFQEYNEKTKSAVENYQNNYPTFSPQPIPTYNPPPTYIPPVAQPTSVLTDEQKQIKKDLLQAEIDQCKANAINKKNKSIQVCYVSPEGTWQENCLSSATSIYENEMEICLYKYEYGISELEN
jgi:hypothetical protein